MLSSMSRRERSSSLGCLGRRQAVEQQVAVGVRSEAHQPRRRHLTGCVPREWGPGVGEVDALLDEPGRQVDGGGNAVPIEDGRGVLRQIGRAVVERHHDRVVRGHASVQRLGGRRPLPWLARGTARRRVQRRRVPGEEVDRGVERDDAAGRGQPGHLLVERLGRQVDLGARAAPDTVVDQHDDARGGCPHAVARRRQGLDRAQRQGPSIRHAASLRGGPGTLPPTVRTAPTALPPGTAARAVAGGVATGIGGA